ncbi:MAG: hypothetical protein R3B82_10300 [Sandaracinaceae bacterium]
MYGQDVLLRPWEARLNITHDGKNADYVEPIAFDASGAEITRMAQEAVRAGLLGAPIPHARLDGYVIDRFPATEREPVNRIFLRPKTPFG